ncbi:ion channel activity [Zygosaccharomyces mellis]|uniref:Ion channel activity n=1 Tax=Zygosaccharomyces mellis TaxID=42258 RepID=A0A4C2EBN0_9SACH|nr:ion channel activity [Zygosaccharomyces mellis]
MFLWFGYPISFGLSEGGNVMQPDSEGIFYGILGVLLLGIPPALFVPVAYNIGFEKLGLNDTVDHYGQGAAPTGSAVSKPPAPLPSAKGTDSADKGDAAKQSSKKTKRVKKVKRPIREPPNEPAEEEISESAGGY